MQRYYVRPLQKMDFDTINYPYFQNSFLFQKHKDSLDVLDAFGDLDLILKRKQNPHQCPQCLMCFKYDIALLRHERKTGHYNPERQLRQKSRYMAQSPKQYSCECSQKFTKSIDLLNHKKVCGKPLKVKQAKMNQLISQVIEKPDIQQCQQLPCQNTVKKQQSPILNFQAKQVLRGHLSQQSRRKLAKELKKYKKLNQSVMQRLSRNLGVSEATIRKYYYECKRRTQQADQLSE